LLADAGEPGEAMISTVGRNLNYFCPFSAFAKKTASVIVPAVRLHEPIATVILPEFYDSEHSSISYVVFRYAVTATRDRRRYRGDPDTNADIGIDLTGMDGVL
jgi:hypothetical protein